MDRPWYRRGWFYITLVGLVIIGVIIWWSISFWADTANIIGRDFINGVWLSWLFPNGWNLFGATPFFWWIVGIGLMLALLRKAMYRKEGKRYYGESTYIKPWWYATLVVVVTICLVLTIRGGWLMDETAANHYTADSRAEFVVDDPENVPSVLAKVERSDASIVNITQGDIQFSWERRVASATGALNVMTRTGDALTNTQLMRETITYIYGKEDRSAWTAIRNGINRQNIYGISTWSGTGETVTTCEFKGQYELDRAFDGTWGRNLSDDIAEFDKLFTYNDNDVYGYCDDGEPVIVIPGTKTVGADVRTVNQSYGVLVIRGSQSGNPVIEHVLDAKPGDFPGPVYPKRLADSQRETLDWAAGRCWMWEECFGLDTTNVSSQAGNSTNFLLRNTADGRLYWVTPLKPASTDSQTLVAYSVIPADEMTSGQLNQQKVYVMNDGDSRIVNLDDLENVVTDTVRTADPGFFTGDSPGKIVEFLPVSDTDWQVFAEVGGRVKYRVDVNVGAKLTSSLFQIDDGSEEEAVDEPSSTTATCDDPSSLNDKELAQCIADLANELQQRG